MNGFRLNINQLLRNEKKLKVTLKTSEARRSNLEKEVMKLNRKILRIKSQTTNEPEPMKPTVSLEEKADKIKSDNSKKIMEVKSRHYEVLNEKLKSRLSNIENQLKGSKKDVHKYKLQVKLLEQQIKIMNKKKTA